MQSAHDVETEEEVFDVLLNYGRQALDRFSSVVDSTSRQETKKKRTKKKENERRGKQNREKKWTLM